MDAIVEAVAQIVARDGLRGVTVRAVATRAGVGMGSLYQFFPTSDTLLVAWEERLLARETSAVAAHITAAIAAARPLGDIVAVAVNQAAAAYLTMRNAYGPTEAWEMLARQSVRDTRGKELEALLAGLFQSATPGSLRALPYHHAARLVVRTVAYVAYDLAWTNAADREGFLRELADMITRYLGPVPAEV